MKKNHTISAFQKQADAAFSNFGGGRPEEFVGIRSNFSQMAGGVKPTFNPDIKPLIFDISNTDESYELAAVLFSANEEISQPFNGVACSITGNTARTGRGIVVTPQGYSNNEIKKMTENSPLVRSFGRVHPSVVSLILFSIHTHGTISLLSYHFHLVHFHSRSGRCVQDVYRVIGHEL